ELVAGGVERDGEAGPVGVDAGMAVGGVGHGGAQELVGDQEGVDLLGETGWGAGAQDAAAQDGGLEFQVGGFDLPSLVVEGGQVGGGMAVVVEQGGGKSVGAGVPAGVGGDGDLGVDHADLHRAQQ